jgi:hypothetical protein
MNAAKILICTLFSLALVGCGGGGHSTDHAVDSSPPSVAPATPTAAPPVATTPEPTPTSPAPALAAPIDIILGAWPTTILQTGLDTSAYWLEDGVWGAGSLTRGAYTGLGGTQYQQSTGVSHTMGPNGEVAGRISWGWPTGTTEVKSYMSLLAGNKPGYANSWTMPAGYEVQLLDGSVSQIYPSGKTPGTIFPLQLPIESLKSSVSYQHNAAPTGRGHLSYDIWLQNTPDQAHGFDANREITHEIMIPLDYWGGYGSYPTRNPSWYSHDATIDGRLWHVYYAPNFNGLWKFIVFEPDQPGIQAGSLDLAAFINYVATQKDTSGTSWANGNEYCVSVELGVEPVDGTGDITIFNYRVWRAN